VNKIIVSCTKCSEPYQLSIITYQRKKRANKEFLCHKCMSLYLAQISKENPLYKSKEYKDKFRKLHKDPNYYNKVHNKKVSNKISKSTKEFWKDPKKESF